VKGLEFLILGFFSIRFGITGLRNMVVILESSLYRGSLFWDSALLCCAFSSQLFLKQNSKINFRFKLMIELPNRSSSCWFIFVCSYKLANPAVKNVLKSSWLNC